jgi:glycosyltransferase involved in cell wall biosynthesis
VEARAGKISVALATWNGAAYLGCQLESIVSQTTPPDEVVCSDDASTDGTVEVVESFSRDRRLPVRILRNESNSGYIENFSRALTHCSGDYVFLSDQDDWWCPNKISTVVGFFGSHPEAVLVIHDLLFCDEALRSSGQNKLDRLRSCGISDKSYVNGMATAVRGKFLRLCLPIPMREALTHDQWLHCCANFVDGRVVLPVVLAHYRRHEGAVTREGALNETSVSRFRFLLSMFVLSRKSVALSHSYIEPLFFWAEKNRNALVEDGFVTSEAFDRSFSDLSKMVKIVRERRGILEARRVSRILKVVVFYFRGGYSAFSGWRSAVLDIVAP